MSALDDIICRLRLFAPPAGDVERFVVIGCSARHSIEADLLANGDPTGDIVADVEHSLKINLNLDILVRETIDFDGWDIVQCDAAGRFTSVAA